MNLKLHEVLQRASQLTRTGRLSEATAAIQQVLMRGRTRTAPPVKPESQQDIIDVEATLVTDPVARTSDRPHAPGRGDSLEAEVALPIPGSFTDGSFASRAGQRSYKLYRPRTAPPQGRPALVVMLHGCTQNPDDFAAGTRMNALAEERGWWVLYPAQTNSANASGCWNWFKPADQKRHQGEPAILAGMTRAVAARAGIDPSRIFVAGLSAGGAMAVTLAATHPELYVAVGVHSGLPHGGAHDLVSALSAMRQGSAAQTLPHRVPSIVFHGDQDSTVHPCNGQAVVQQARGVPNTNIDLDPGAVETEQSRAGQGHRYTRTVHRDATGRVDAEHWLVHGAGHAWSGGSPTGTYTDPLGPDASTEMLRFFNNC